jgi:anthranilate synthase component 2
VQFHPESIASDHGHLLLKNFLDIAAAWNASAGRRGTMPMPPAFPPAQAGDSRGKPAHAH